MSRYDSEDYSINPNVRQKDLVLSTNEFCFLQNRTNGAIKTYTGPIMLTISQQESLVVFNSKTKRFEETTDFEKARQLFTSAPEGWYVVLKNPSHDDSHPEEAKAINSPELKIGRKVNIPGPCSFSLYPGQMAKVVQGHRLRSNQYLIARVYDAVAAEANRSSATIVNTSGEEVDKTSEGCSTNAYYAGQLLVIKGTEVSFYIPPTGIEVLAVGEKDGRGGNNYIREAVTLERLEYAILKDEDGEKRYVHGPAVVFPEPTETFVETPKGGTIFRALELSPISGIYIKVIAEYYDLDKEGNQILHPIGEELFITGNDQMIYYPRPEHAMIQYDGKYMHHAIAIPEGEGRYVMNRLTGEIKTVIGPKMYLPDPRFEVVVKRKLTAAECSLFYPGNDEVIAYNNSISERNMEKMANRGAVKSITDTLYCTSNQEASLAIFEANANISRGTSYTKPRTITLDTKFDGVVSIDVWTGYAVNVISKTGNRRTVIGPQTVLLDYNETLEVTEVLRGVPKNEDNCKKIVYLQVENNKVRDIVEAVTKDFVNVRFDLSYCVDFLEDYKDKWFSVENYVKHLCNRMRSLLKKEIKKYTIEEVYAQAIDIVREIVLRESNKTEKNVDATGKVPSKGRFFPENGMWVKDVDVLDLKMNTRVAEIFNQNQDKIIKKTLELSNAAKEMEMITELSKYETQKLELENARKMYALELQNTLLKEENKFEQEKAQLEKALEELHRENVIAEEETKNIQQEKELERTKKKTDESVRQRNEMAKIDKDRENNYAEVIAKIMSSISPGLIEALTSSANASMLEAVSESMSPYAIAKNESVAEVTDKLLRGTTLEGIFKNMEK